MANTMEHERMRWRTMTVSQLRSRLGKITDLTKISNFITLAVEHGYMDLAQQARDQYAELSGGRRPAGGVKTAAKPVRPEPKPEVIKWLNAPDAPEWF